MNFRTAKGGGSDQGGTKKSIVATTLMTTSLMGLFWGINFYIVINTYYSAFYRGQPFIGLNLFSMTEKKLPNFVNFFGKKC